MIFPAITRKRVLIVAILAAIVVAAVVIALYFTVWKPKDEPTDGPHKMAIVANGMECADIGMSILKQKGSAADAALATLFCEGVTCPQSMGLGGGFVMTIYSKEKGQVESLMAREVAPLAATEDMFKNGTVDSVEGGLAIAVPGELRGYWEVHQKYGVLPWADLIQPTIELCRQGHLVSPYLENILRGRATRIYAVPSLREIYINPETNTTWQQGDRIKRLQLAQTLEVIAAEGVDALYNGTLTKGFIEDIQNFGGIVTEEDLLEYRVRWEKPVTARLKSGYTLYSTAAPSSGPLLAFILNIMDDFMEDMHSPVTWHRVIESFKHAYARRTQMGDPAFVPSVHQLVANLTNPEFAKYVRSLIDDDTTYNTFDYYGAEFGNVEDHGTAHVSVLAPNGDAVAATSTVNYIFGAMRRSQSTGIILNDEMDDFSIPGKDNVYGIPSSPANFVYPRKTPMSSMCPSILVDREGNARMIVGGAGGSKITTSVSYLIMRHLLFNESLMDAMHAKRIHHQLAPMRVDFENGFSEEIIKGFSDRNHEVYEVSPGSGFAALTAISFDGANRIDAVFDPRRNGSSSISEM
ncbi:glutathione hydrolase 1 proenzyme-like isoform X2 [Lutzomyia longipalpis]|uniref:Putative gamma-glutamyltransferase n=1 Tax=Lutzomyia longipalpis TaxID=7200 RepID=A0A7G3AIE1_LUTLO|nr:glutathione hydrolase 1 proenzyme-like isoform X2 [Lutzomyia longipalpis]